ncbi:phosphatase 2C-like domain-containing protein [Sphaerosporella brunnea]|uniref:Phosphatase 2C-like domain-containing protein n=1 Tax=Sphaerosporella brunnea TaxID=1250544 RepID=A0A5J5EG82_9PEZI|nr:phosphatase 2C-like domain-containing protein [Sphaerosporella brunnea]
MFGTSNNGSGAADTAAPSKEEKNSSSQTHPAPPTLDTKAATAKTPKKKTSKARELIASARNSLSASISSSSNSSSSPNEDKEFSRILKEDPQIRPPGAHNNSAGESKPGPRTTFRVGVSEDKNRKCRRTMEDTHAYLYNFLPEVNASGEEAADSDNGYFAIFDGHAGTYAAEWCGRKLHVILEETIRKHPNTPLPELLDMTFTNCDGQLEKLPVKNSGCTAVCAVMRWEDRPVPNSNSVEPGDKSTLSKASDENVKPNTPALSTRTARQRILYTANVGDARIVLCRGGKALRLSYDHKGSDENEGKRVANAGGLILNNRVNGVLAVTRALGDSYMKDLVTGHPYTTESVLQSDLDEFIILACDGLWDVCSDQEAVDLVRDIKDPQEASKKLVDHALGAFSSDNLSCMIVRLDPTGKFEGIPASSPGASSEAGKTEERQHTAVPTQTKEHTETVLDKATKG